MVENFKIEYDASLSLLKYYDEREVSLVKYATGLSSALGGVVFGAKQLGPPLESVFWPLVALFAGSVWTGLVAVYLCMIENRLYFVFPARQANWLRGILLAEVDALAENQMFLSTGVPAYRPRSAHSSMLMIVSLQVGAALGLSMFAAYYSFRATGWALLVGAITGLLSTLGLSAWSAVYLTRRSRMTADVAVGQMEQRGGNATPPTTS
jgi:hypothetical protein